MITNIHKEVLPLVGLFLCLMFSQNACCQNEDSLLNAAEMPFDYSTFPSFENRLTLHQLSIKDCTLINFTDNEGKKQGLWRYTGAMKPLEAGYDSTSIIQECMYRHNRKHGYCLDYYPNGKLKSLITYKYNRPNGYYAKFDTLSDIIEEGIWRGYKYDHFRQFKNGCVVQEKIWTKTSKKIWFFETACDSNRYGRIERVEFIENTNISESSSCNFGLSRRDDLRKVDTSKYVLTKRNKEVRKHLQLDFDINEPSELKMHLEIPISGYYRIYNMNGEIKLDGLFENNDLINGKHYLYDENELLERIEVYKNAEYIGDGVIDF